MSNNLSKLLVPSRINLLVERAFRGHELIKRSVFHYVPRIQVDDVVGRQCFFLVFTRAPVSRRPYRTFDFESWRFQAVIRRASETPRSRPGSQNKKTT